MVFRHEVRAEGVSNGLSRELSFGGLDVIHWEPDSGSVTYRFELFQLRRGIFMERENKG